MNGVKRIAIVATFSLLVATGTTAQNAVTQWNSIAISEARSSAAPGSATPGGAGVYVAYVQLAVYNAVNAIDGRFEPYKYSLTAPAGASEDAAAIEAAYRTLRHLHRASSPVSPRRVHPLVERCAAGVGAQRSPDHKALDLACALEDRVELRVAVPLLDREVLDVAPATQGLDALFAGAHRGL